MIVDKVQISRAGKSITVAVFSVLAFAGVVYAAINAYQSTEVEAVTRTGEQA